MPGGCRWEARAGSGPPEQAIEKLFLGSVSGRKSLFLAFWQRQKAKLGLGEGFEGRGEGAVPPGPLPNLLENRLSQNSELPFLTNVTIV